MPCAGYHFNEELSAGITSRYRYFHSPFTTIHIFGAGVFCNYALQKEIGNILPVRIMAHTEAETVSFPTESQRKSDALLWAGPGLRQKMSKNTYFNFLLLWKVLPSEIPIPAQTFRLGFYF